MKNKISYLCCIGLILVSCGNFLEPKSKSEFVPKEIASLNELLLGEAYPKIGDGNMNVFLGLLDDDIACAPFKELPVGRSRAAWYPVFSWQPDMYEKMKEAGETPNIYGAFYAKILGANAVLDYIGDMKGDILAINQVKAQALALRSFYFFNLVNLFGKPYNQGKESLGIPLKLNSGIEIKPLERNTVKEAYDQIREDLLEAARLYKTLPEDMWWRQDYRTSLPMVQLLLSRVYLYTEQWKEAVDYAEKVINDYSFHLLDLNDISDVNEYGGRTYFNYHSSSSSEVIWNYGNISDVTKMIGTMSKEEAGTRVSRCIFKASDELMACLSELDGDLRPNRYVVGEKEPSIDKDGRQYYIKQPFGKIFVTSEFRPRNGAFARSFRLSEAYLNLCEASAMLYKFEGNSQACKTALDKLNMFRSFRVERGKLVAETTTDPDKLIQTIREERRRELCFEDHRWFDLKRYGMPEIKHVWIPDATSSQAYTLNEKDFFYALPFPTKALELNKALVQNPLGAVRVQD